MQKKRNLHKQSDKKTEKILVHEKLDGSERNGLLVAHFGASAEVEDPAGDVFHCHLRRNAEPSVTGDEVLWRLEKDNETGVVVSVLPRRSLLARPEKHNKLKLIAANIDAIIIVVAPPPLLSERLIDRYLVAAENLKIQPVILLNKVDLLSEEELAELKEDLSVYTKMGYPVIYSSIYQDGLHDLGSFLMGKTGVLVGVSGVGKSSIIAAFTGLANIMIGDVSTVARLGKHTTTTTRLYHLPRGGNLIDSPGVREFSLWHLPQAEILQGFVDFHPFLGLCKYRNCLHQSEPGCALLQAVAENKISSERWHSYQEIVQDLGGD
jgi:ribosome biogenesis GTPase